MKKIITILALCAMTMCAVSAYALPVTDAVKTFYSKGNCIDIEVNFAEDSASATFSIIFGKAQVLMATAVSAQFDDEKKELFTIFLGEHPLEIPMEYVKSIANDAAGNLVITTKTLTEDELKEFDSLDDFLPF